MQLLKMVDQKRFLLKREKHPANYKLCISFLVYVKVSTIKQSYSKIKNTILDVVRNPGKHTKALCHNLSCTEF